ncbi:unnamed protein product [Agarophyton chilense]
MPTRTVGRYRLTRQLGVGMFSKVMLGVDDRSGATYAVKVMSKDSLEDMDMARYARREAAVLRKLSHPNIVAFVEAIQSDTKLFLVMHIAPGRELLDVVANGPLSEPDAKLYMAQLVDAVAYLHSKGVAHRDLKPDNVLVDVPTRTLKIIDFGLTGLIRRNSLMTTSCGSSYYSAPEITFGNGLGYDGAKADAWTLGILAYILLTGAHPFVDNNGQLMTAMMRQGFVEYPHSLSRAAMHFTSRLLTLDPTKRYSVAQVSLHPWLTGRPAPTSAHHPPQSKKELQPEQHPDLTSLSVKRVGTFSTPHAHKPMFGRSHSDRHNQSSPSLATRRRSSHKSNNSSFFWFRRQNLNQQLQDDHQQCALEDEFDSPQNRKASVERSRGLLEGFASRREGRLTFDFITSRSQTESTEATPRARRQLSLTSRTKALLMRTSLGSLEPQQQ